MREHILFTSHVGGGGVWVDQQKMGSKVKNLLLKSYFLPLAKDLCTRLTIHRTNNNVKMMFFYTYFFLLIVLEHIIIIPGLGLDKAPSIYTSHFLNPYILRVLSIFYDKT